MYKITITFKDKENDGVDLSLEADPPWHGPASDVKPKDMTPAQRMQLQWFQAIAEMYTSMQDEDDE